MGKQDDEARFLRSLHRQSRCVMVLPEDLAGARVLDLGCRNGLGAYKIADRVGSSGLVVGVDPCEARIERARARACEHHWAGEGWERYLKFVVADFGGLASALKGAGLAVPGFDVVVVNSVLNVAPDLCAALSEIREVLVPGGYLYHDAVLADASDALPAEVVGQCRAERNVFGTAVSRERFSACLRDAGYGVVEMFDEEPLAPPPGDARQDLAGRAFCSAVVRAFA